MRCIKMCDIKLLAQMLISRMVPPIDDDSESFRWFQDQRISATNNFARAMHMETASLESLLTAAYSLVG